MTEAQEMLGVYLSPDCSCQTQYETLMNKAAEFGERIRVNRHEAWLGLTTSQGNEVNRLLPTCDNTN